MKKKVWNKKTLYTQRSTGCWMSLKPIQGSISFSRDAINAMEAEGKSVSFIQDENKPDNWYMEISDDADAIPIRVNKKASGIIQVFIIQNVSLVRHIYKSLGLDPQSCYRMVIGTEKNKDGLFEIVTKSAKRVDKREYQKQVA